VISVSEHGFVDLLLGDSELTTFSAVGGIGADLFISGTVVPYRPVVDSIVSSPDTSVHTVERRVGRGLSTGTDGAVSTVTLNRVSGIAQPDTAIVEVQTSSSTGEPVPDSGKRFIVIFQ
jgi:hypothetical protein